MPSYARLRFIRHLEESERRRVVERGSTASVRRVLRGIAILSACLFLTACRTEGPDVPDDPASFIERILLAEDARDPGDPILAYGLTHEDPRIRRYAYRALGRIGGARVVEALYRAALAETYPALRAEAVYAMGLCAHTAVVEAAESFILDESFAVRAAVMRALGLSGDERALIPLIDGLEDDAQGVREEAALGLARLARSNPESVRARPFGAFSSLAYRLAEEPLPGVRHAVAYAVSVLAREEFRPALVQATRDPDWRVRAFACDGLSVLEIGEDERAALIERLRDERWPVVVAAAKALAGESGRDDVFRALVRVLGGGEEPEAKGHPSHHARAAAAASLAADPPHDDAGEALAAALGDPSDSVRAAALESIAAVLDPVAARAVLEAVLASAERRATPYVRSRVASAAGALAGEAGFPLLRDLLDDRAPAVRAAAIQTLPRFPSRVEEVERRIEQALQESDVAVRDAAAIAAAELGRSSLAPAVRAALLESDGPEFIEPRVSLIKALAATQGISAISTIRRYLRDPEAAVRKAARDEIARLGGEVPRLPRPDPPDRVVDPRAGVDFLRPDRPRVTLVTDRGEVVLELLADEAPVHATAFMKRCREGFYDGLSFHRLVPGFVIQGLDPRGDGYGTGGPTLRGEINAMRYGRGVVGMPDAGPDTGGCQVFITFRPEPRLDDRYTAFARVVEGMDVVEALDVGDRVDYVIAPLEPEPAPLPPYSAE